MFVWPLLSFLFSLNSTPWKLEIWSPGRTDMTKMASLSWPCIFSHIYCKLTLIYNSFFFSITKMQQRTIPGARENHTSGKRNAISAYSGCINAGIAKVIVIFVCDSILPLKEVSDLNMIVFSCNCVHVCMYHILHVMRKYKFQPKLNAQTLLLFSV